MNQTGVITCGGEEFQNWASDPRYEILSVETPKPGVYRFTPRLKWQGLVRGTTVAHNHEQAGATPAPATTLDHKGLRAVEADAPLRLPCEAEESSLVAPPANPSQQEEAGTLFGNATPENPSGVARPQDDPPTSPIPAGTLSKRIELLPADIADFLLRQRRMEIVITGQMPHVDGRRTVFEYVEASKYRPEQQNSPEVRIERLQAICEVCQGPLETDGTCNICAVGDRIFNKARQNRRAYHEMKKAGL